MTTLDENCVASVNNKGVLAVTMIGNLNRELVVAVLYEQWELGYGRP